MFFFSMFVSSVACFYSVCVLCSLYFSHFCCVSWFCFSLQGFCVSFLLHVSHLCPMFHSCFMFHKISTKLRNVFWFFLSSKKKIPTKNSKTFNAAASDSAQCESRFYCSSVKKKVTSDFILRNRGAALRSTGSLNAATNWINVTFRK